MKTKEKLVLIVDDEHDICWALEHILEKRGIASKKASTGQEALLMMRTQCFTLVFLDAKLEDTEGWELAREIRVVDPAIPIVMISGYFYKDDASVQKALAEGLIRDFIGKPFLHDEIQKVTEILNGFCDSDTRP